MSTLSQFFPAGGNVPSNAIPIELLVVAGGAGTYGSGIIASGGAGAGRVVYIRNLYVIPSVAYTVTVGAAGGWNSYGGNSGFSPLITAYGGAFTNYQGFNTRGGGSGAGGGALTNASSGRAPLNCNNSKLDFPFGNPTTTQKLYVDETTVIQDMGHPGGNAVPAPGGSSNFAAGGGGGGACGPGHDAGGYSFSNQNSYCTGRGGSAFWSEITGTLYHYGGGGDGKSNGASSFTAGGYTAQLNGNAPQDTDAVANSGGGSGGSFSYAQQGGSGVVVVAYANTYSAASTTGSPSNPTRTGYRVYNFTGSGSITFA